MIAPTLKRVSALERWREESLMLDFVSGEPLDDRLTTVRASEASYFDADGVLRFMPANRPRIDYDPITRACRGLLVEEARTNWFSNSENYTAGIWAKSGLAVDAGAAISPDGTLNATRFVATLSSYPRAQRMTVLGSGVSVLSFFAKKDTTDMAHVTLEDAATVGTIRLYVNLSNGAIIVRPSGSPSHSVTAYTQALRDGWFRIFAVVNIPFSANLVSFFGPATTDNAALVTVGASIFVYGAQFETGAFPTSYIRTLPEFQSRASVKTYFDAQGAMRTAGVNEPAIDHGYVDGKWLSKGLSVEPVMTNHAPHSGTFETWTKVNVAMSANGVTAPDGTIAKKLTANTSGETSPHHMSRSMLTSFPAGTQVTVSVHAKAAEVTHMCIRLDSTSPAITGSPTFLVNLITGETAISGATAVNAIGYVEKLADGWWRVAMTVTTTSAGALAPLIMMAGSLSGFAFAGDGSKGMYFWGAQTETSARATSYIATEAAAVTRAADVAPSTNTTRATDRFSIDTAPWYKLDGGTFFAAASTFTTAANSNRTLYHAGVSDAERVAQYISTSGAVLSRIANGTQVANPPDAVIPGGAAPLLTGVTAGMTYASGTQGAAAVIAGGTITTVGPVVVAALPVPPILHIGVNSGGSFSLNGHMQRLAYIPRRLTNDQLRQLSTR